MNSAMIEYVNGLIATVDYPALAALDAEVGLDAAWAQVDAHRRDPDRFSRNLARLLDGIAADVPPASP